MVIQIKKTFWSSTTGFISILGRGGIGKTALACKVLSDVEQELFIRSSQLLKAVIYLSTRTSGINAERAYFDLSYSLNGVDQEKLEAEWRNPQKNTNQKIDHLLDHLRNGPIAVLLDNLDDVLTSDGDFVDENLDYLVNTSLSKNIPIRWIATSRIPINLKGESKYQAKVFSLNKGLPLTEGMQMLRDLDTDGHYGLKQAPNAQLVEVVKLVHGIPRALELITALLAQDPYLSLSDILDVFFKRYDVVTELASEYYGKLDISSRRVLDALAVFRKPSSKDAISFLLQPYLYEIDISEIIFRLARLGVINLDRESKLLSLHPIDQDLAYASLFDDKEVEGTSAYSRRNLEHRAAAYYQSIRTPHIKPTRVADLEPQLQEIEHLQRAGEFEQACDLLREIDYSYLHLWGYYEKLKDIWERLLLKVEKDKYRMQCHESIGRALRNMGSLNESRSSYNKALQLARNINDASSLIRILSSLSMSSRGLGDITLSINYSEEAIAVAKSIGDRRREAALLGNIANCHVEVGRFETGESLQLAALAILRSESDRRSEGITLGQLGFIYRNLGRYDDSIRSHTQSLVISRELGDRRGIDIQLNLLATAHRVMGNAPRAMSLYEESLEIARNISDKRGEGYCLLGLSKIHASLGSYNEAIIYATKCTKLNMPDTDYLANISAGQISLLLKKVDIAHSYFKQAMQLCSSVLDLTPQLFIQRYSLATAVFGYLVSSPNWTLATEQTSLLSKVRAEFTKAMIITRSPGTIAEVTSDILLFKEANINEAEVIVELLHSKESP